MIAMFLPMLVLFFLPTIAPLAEPKKTPTSFANLAVVRIHTPLHPRDDTGFAQNLSSKNSTHVRSRGPIRCRAPGK
ncbi:hypothetical protein JMJ77_0013263 [Colletotrichum scovillei]|uniref:Secreted protein n=1 Tax=Colletotrichum scovillei TaxID=1209932 RepID=A0A9P7R8F8_9PEZI|nr:hypothetical protein JMJ77_0013263 [Colletotrichum scovillei]KAG7069558.1 hypothetical protein JMJ76_0003226 [Colletotrichum scovillei]KAG7073508.1 hypothetical protein JMJ78_0014482 [Colletotrichum scovillei]